MMQTFRKISLYAATLWLGMQIMAGYIAAPVLFKMLPKMQAGEIAGVLFDILSWSGLAVWGTVLAAALAANQFLVTPVIEALKYGHENWLLSVAGGSFGMWHGISSMTFMATALLSAVLSWRLSGKEAV
ncbi:DUF4149 domain-containing protein [Neisseria gonorrhoeae]|uniref:DUF4149 domain-containing protein n=1 Tax=Neisseria gonorrhoeae TaxID=485 RepID=UPI0027D9AD88|nr:DUF4149 domain-containing protein [Neisseria gonorrhoeae]